MGYAVARIGDTTHGTCTGHQTSITVDGVIITGVSAGDVFGNGILIATIGCTVQASCGHTGIINSGSPTVTSGDGMSIARIGDTFTGTYYGTITSGSPDIFAE